ncbi:MAG: hypothetical protein BWY09_00592 [Candidatus Hydrogenedentes bacterium ADurb.Bin179]|nr:MAG: hypothetical protein BWY09_00592 [Candidatus Hydrogenedentes bacterium ADurb.Bin179]
MRLEGSITAAATRTGGNIARNLSDSCALAVGYDILFVNPGVSVAFLGSYFASRDSFLFTADNASS